MNSDTVLTASASASASASARGNKCATEVDPEVSELTRVAAARKAAQEALQCLEQMPIYPTLSLPCELKMFRITSKLGEGSFGVIYAGEDMYSNQPVALKFGVKSAIQHETRVLIHLNAMKVQCIPAPVWYGQLEGRWNYVMMERMGCSLRSILSDVHSVKWKTVLQLGVQMMECLQQVHLAGILHADINLSNWMTGYGSPVKENKLFLVDFGLARTVDYQNSLCATAPLHMTGTPMYVSAFVHDGRPNRREDDVIAAIHCLCHLYFGKLEWMAMEWHEMPAKKRAFASHPDVPDVFRSILRELYSEKIERPAYDTYVAWMRDELRERYGCNYPTGIHNMHTVAASARSTGLLSTIPPLEWI